jgi:hypothetical protein
LLDRIKVKRLFGFDKVRGCQTVVINDKMLRVNVLRQSIHKENCIGDAKS